MAKIKNKRLRVCRKGCRLLTIFLVTLFLLAVYLVVQIVNGSFVADWKRYVLYIIAAAVIEFVIFWDGIIRVYITSMQLGMKWRIIGIVCAWIPIVNIIALGKIIKVASAEVKVENAKIILNEERRSRQICATRYPLLLVHGVFFRDFRYFNYWGRIPEQLEANGAKVYYGNHESAENIAKSGEKLYERIKEICAETGCEKVNIIAHSKGGLDARYAISMLGAAPYVASLTTINTPHRGCEFADYLLSKIPEAQKQAVAHAYNAAVLKMGDKNPDFLAAVGDLTASACASFNEQVPDAEGVYYQSAGSILNVARGGRFPLNLSHHLVKYFDGANDGLVGEKSFEWGEHFEYLTVKGRRGISHGDMIDLNRENLPEFDVREYYVQLVAKLKDRGY